MSAHKKRLLITGISGLLGNNLAYCLKDRYEILGIYNSHPCYIPGIKLQQIDLTNELQVSDLLADFRPECVIHCAALSDIEYCETHQEDAKQVNVKATENLVNLVNSESIKFIYISTDAIYEDMSHEPHKETDPIAPTNYYGQTKFEGESEALKKENSCVIRTNIFGWNIQEKQSIAEWIVHDLSQKNEIQGFHDAEFSSIYTFDLAELLSGVISKDLRGVYNIGSKTSITKLEFANQLAERFGLDKNLIKPSSVDDFGFKAKRRKLLALDVTKIEKDLSIDCPTMEECLDRFHADYKDGIPGVIKNIDYANVYPDIGFLNYGRQFVDQQDIDAVVEVLKSRNLTQGPYVTQFENFLSKTVDAKHSIATNSGTSALHIACLAAQVEEGDEVITSPNTFVASANCALYCGATPVLVDIEPETQNISAQALEQAITEKTKAIIPVHFAGQMADMKSISEIVKKKESEYGHKIYIIEDGSHALGSKYRNTKAGSCAYSDMTIMSFHPVKHITTGEGGVVITNCDELYKKLSRFRSHGITSAPNDFVNEENAFTNKPRPNMWYYEQQFLGFNYRITDIQCALGTSQLKRLPYFVKRRSDIVRAYNEAFKDHPLLKIPFEKEECQTNWHLYVLRIDFDSLGVNRDSFMRALMQEGIQTQVHYIPIHLQPYYQKQFGYKWGDYPHAENYYKQCLSIPLFPMMEDKEVQMVINLILKMINAKTSITK